LTTWSLITVSFNSGDQLRKFWTSGRPPDNIEWIVVDNQSADNSVAIAKQAGATHVIRLGKNRGFGFANNVGLSIAQGEYIAFVNPDVRVDFGSLDILKSAIDRRGSLVAPQLVNIDGTLQPNGRGFPTLQNKIGNRTGRRIGRYFITADSTTSRYVCWVIGAAISGRRQTFEQMNGWDERFFIYYEDSDICLRAWALGVPVELIGSVNWMHGWKRETTNFRLSPWVHEVASMSKFYWRYPYLSWFESLARKKYGGIYQLMGAEAVTPRTER
jgi:N-acetylglucosaminyl-diphospho-decaprenol L-rhamnosyltransferase